MSCMTFCMSPPGRESLIKVKGETLFFFFAHERAFLPNLSEEWKVENSVLRCLMSAIVFFCTSLFGGLCILVTPSVLIRMSN